MGVHESAIGWGSARRLISAPFGISWGGSTGAGGSNIIRCIPGAGRLVLTVGGSSGRADGQGSWLPSLWAASPRAAEASSQHGGWVLRVNSLREPGEAVAGKCLTTGFLREAGDDV